MKISDQKSLLAPTNFWRIVIVFSILVCGFVTRLYDLTDPPLDYSPTRQLRSAMIARGIYYSTLPEAPEWQKDIASKGRDLHSRIEPEIIENITAATYHLVGGEYVWIARIYSSLFWVLGGLALFLLTRQIVSDDGGILALIYYLFVPFGLVASRTFQPDPMMTAMIITAWMAFYYWDKSSSWKWAILAGLTAGLAMYIKSTSVFFLFPVMALVVVSRKKISKTIRDSQVWVIALLSAIPVLAYHIYGLFISGILERQLKGRFYPQMWDDPDFYVQWKNAISNVSGHYLILVIGLLGLYLVSQKRDRLFLVAIWAGYIIYGYGFSYHISTHYYYTLPVIPLLAITIGAVADWIFYWARKINLDSVLRVGTVLLVIMGVAGGYFIFFRKDYHHEPPYYKKVANFFSPEDKVIALSQDYGYRLSYFGWRVVQNWRGSEDSQFIELNDSKLDPFSDRFSQYSSNFDYFLVTRMAELRKQKDLFAELYDHYPILAEGGGYVIFDLRERIE